MKKIKIIPFIIAVLFPLVCTTFIVCYSYGVNDIYTTNKNKYEIYTQNKYFDDKGDATDEVEKGVKLDAYKYQASPGNLKINDSIVSGSEYKTDELTTSLYAYTAHTKTDDKTTINIAYTLYVYDILYKNKYVVDSFTTAKDGLLLKDNGTLQLVYVKGTGEWAKDRLAKALDEIQESGSTTSGTLVSASSGTNVYDNNATNYKGDTDDEKPYVYRFSLFNSTSSEFYDFGDLSEIYSEQFNDKYGSSVEIPEDPTNPDNSSYYNDDNVKEGYTIAVLNLYNNYSGTIKYRQLYTMTIDTVYSGEDFEDLTTTTNGYRGDYTNAGYSYIGYVWPTLLWQGALTLVVTGVLGVLFYLIWQTEPEQTEQQKNIKNLQKSKKQAKKQNSAK